MVSVAGKDATEQFMMLHKPSVLTKYVCVLLRLLPLSARNAAAPTLHPLVCSFARLLVCSFALSLCLDAILSNTHHVGCWFHATYPRPHSSRTVNRVFFLFVVLLQAWCRVQDWRHWIIFVPFIVEQPQRLPNTATNNQRQLLVVFRCAYLHFNGRV